MSKNGDKTLVSLEKSLDEAKNGKGEIVKDLDSFLESL